MTQRAMFGADPTPAAPDRLTMIEQEIVALQAQISTLRAEEAEIKAALRLAELDAKIAKMPPEVLEMLRLPAPRAEDMKRLVPRGLAYTSGSGGRFRYTKSRWTDLRDQIVARIKETQP